HDIAPRSAVHFRERNNAWQDGRRSVSGWNPLGLVVEDVHGRAVGKGREGRVGAERRAAYRALGASADAIDVAPDVLEHGLAGSREDIGNAVEDDGPRGVQ